MERDDLAEYLDSLAREDSYCVEKVLKESAYEVTERVSFMGANGTKRGPYIRKLIAHDSNIGSAYERVYNAQQQGQRFKHVPTIYECYPNDKGLVVVMEFAHGETLQDLVYRENPSLGLAQRVFPLLCDAVSELHEDFQPPLIHRDLKPSNIMVSDNGLTIIDFGIAREYREGAPKDTTHFGTRSFAPPEQFGFGQTTVRSDVYALGMLLFFCLTEKIPEASTMKRELDDNRIPIGLQEVIARATAFDPSFRYASARELKEAFAKGLPGASAARDSKGPESEKRGSMQSEPGQPADACGKGQAVASQSARAGVPVGMSAFVGMGAPAGSYSPAVPGQQGDLHSNRSFQAPASYASAHEIQGRIPGAKSRFKTLGIVWDVLLVCVEVLFLIACVNACINPSSSTDYYPTWVQGLAYLVVFPLFFLACGVLISDKRPIKRLIPATRNLRAVHWIVGFIVVVFALFLFFGIMNMAFPRPTA